MRGFFDDEEYTDEPSRGCPWLIPRLTSGPAIIGFADEDKPYSANIDDLEAMALAPPDVELPESFGSDNPKYSHFRRQTFKNNLYRPSSRWDVLFQQTHIFLIDPKDILRSERKSEPYLRLCADGLEGRAKSLLSDSLTRAFLHMDPQIWVHLLTLLRAPNHLLSPFPDYEGFVLSFNDRLQWTRPRHSRATDYINARRLVLRSQALNKSLLAFNPVAVQPDGTLNWDIGYAPATRVAASIDTKLVYDSGFPRDLPVLLQGQRAKEILVEGLKDEFILARATDGLIKEERSFRHQQIQFAGIAAGLASELYTCDRTRDKLPNQFASVWVNGRRMQ